MTRPLLIENITAALQARLFPTVTVWNRIEPRPRSVDFSRALRAEVRDALWMLARQWQLGEFRGEDAGSPISVTCHLATSTVTGFQPGDGPAGPFDAALPLEAVVERRSPAFAVGDDLAALDLRLVMGRQWLRLVPAPLRPGFVTRYAITPPDPTDQADVELVAHLEVLAQLAAVAGRAMDGYLLWRHLVAAPGNHPYDGMVVPDGDKPALDATAVRFVRWFRELISQPDTPSWDPTRLEHRFTVSAPSGGGEKRLRAEEFPGGHLDWHAFSVDPAAAPPPVPGPDGGAGGGPVPGGPVGPDGGPVQESGAGGGPAPGGAAESLPAEGTVTRTVLPAPVAYDGMPDPRWWAFEDRRTSFADIRSDTTDLARLMFTEFGLVYSNDWFLVPSDLPAGTVASVRGLAVTNVFGERLWIEPAGAGADEDWQRWTMFTLDVTGSADAPADTSLLLLPTVPKTSEGPPLEEVLFIRDEMANMVWGVERTVPLASGDGRRGAETAAESLAYRQRLAGTAPPGPAPAAPIRYQVMNTVPEYWIPFVPVHVPDSNREIQLQRAAMPRILDTDPPTVNKVRPRTSVLRVGLDEAPARPYFVHEEEVPRAGTRVSVAYRRTRWTGGRVVVWLAAHRETGRGEASSGLAFDTLVPTEPPAG